MTKEEKIISITEATVAAYSNSPVWYKSSIIKYMNEFAKEQTTSLKAEVESLKSQLAKAEAEKQELLNLISRLDDYFFCEKQLKEGEYEDLIDATHNAINKHGNNK